MNQMNETTPNLSQELAIRKQKITDMRDQGIEPWPEMVPVDHTAKDILTAFGTDQQASRYDIAGRIMGIRGHGKTIFADIQDGTALMQLYVRQDGLGEQSFEQFKRFVDVGDILWCAGTPFRTKMGEITLELTEWKMLSKSLHPLPEKYHGLADTEIRYRQRYLDLISSAESKQKFATRSRIIRALRAFLDRHQFLEVETPMLHPIAGGAAARPFITHHNALSSDFYLRIAPELYLKRLVVGGFERVYEINRNFRNEGVSTRHNPEFTMLEFYMAYQEYQGAMTFVEELLRFVLTDSVGNLAVPFGAVTIDFAQPFKRISIVNAVTEIGGIPASDLTADSIDATMRAHGVKAKHSQAAHAEKIYALFEELVESKLIQPTFVIDFPIEVSPLAKRDAHNPAIAARFELFIGGMEISNGFNELNDPLDQAERFKQQLVAHRAGDEEAHQYDADYILALEHALPPTAGVGIGIDRLVMLATNTTSIKDVILFPTLKKKHD
ncbi:MAG: lysine--tRNA ligase [Candidatus Babeliales bacterium]